jgi:hypothetical protein
VTQTRSIDFLLRLLFVLCFLLPIILILADFVLLLLTFLSSLLLLPYSFLSPACIIFVLSVSSSLSPPSRSCYMQYPLRKEMNTEI